MRLVWAATLVWLLLIAISDLRQRRIPNVLSLGAAGLALLVLAAQGASALGGSVSSALAAAGIAAALTLPAYIGNLLGAGDVKLAVAMGLLSDAVTFGVGFVAGASLAGVWAVLWLLAQKESSLAPRPCGSEPAPAGMTPVTRRRPVPFGAALCAGFAASMLLRAVSQGM